MSEKGGARTAVASLAAIGSVILASSCCLPLFPFAAAAGTAGSSAVLTSLRPYLLGASLLFVSFGFYQAWRGKQCDRRPNPWTLGLLWASAFLVFISIFFPQVVANVAVDLLAL